MTQSMSCVIRHSLILHYLASASVALHIFLGPNYTSDYRESLDAQTIETPYDLRVTSQTYDTEYVVCHRSFSHPPLFSISFVGASSFLGTQPYERLSVEFGCANDWNTIRVTFQTYDTEYVVCHRSFSHPPLFTGPLFTSNFNRVCPVRYHNQCHITFQRLRAQNEQPSEGKPEKSVYGSRLNVQQ